MCEHVWRMVGGWIVPGPAGQPVGRLVRDARCDKCGAERPFPEGDPGFATLLPMMFFRRAPDGSLVKER